MREKIEMGEHEPLYVFVKPDGAPSVWGHHDEVNMTVFGDFWRAKRDPGSKTNEIRALTQDDLRTLLRGRWSHVTHLVYRPAADGYQVSKETLFQTA